MDIDEWETGVVRYADRQFAGYDAQSGGGAAGGGSDCSGRYEKQYQTVESFRHFCADDKLP